MPYSSLMGMTFLSADVVSAADSWDQRPLWSVSWLWRTCHHFHVALMPFPWFHEFFYEISISCHSLIYDFDPPLIPHSVYTLVLNPIIKWKHAWSNSIIHFQNCYTTLVTLVSLTDVRIHLLLYILSLICAIFLWIPYLDFDINSIKSINQFIKIPIFTILDFKSESHLCAH